MKNNNKKKWEERLKNTQSRDYDFNTMSGNSLDVLYHPQNIDQDYIDTLGFPGDFPYTRGIHTNLYRGKLWTMRQFAGFGTPKETNQRFKFLLKNGQTGLSVAFDMPTLMGYDADHPISNGEVGHCGVSISSLADMEELFDGIDLSMVSVSMTINGPAIILFAFYVAVALKQNCDIKNIKGTLQNDILKEYMAQKEWIFPPNPSIRIITDMIEYCSKEMPKYNTISVSGYHIREAGSTADQELAFTLANGFEYVKNAIKRGLNVDDFANRISFFFNSHSDFFEEIAKFRAARRIWAKVMKTKFKAKNEKSMQLRFHTQTAGCSLTAQQPENNITRTSIQALAAILGGTQSLHTNSLDETLALPSEKAVEIALRSQQIIAYETGAANVVDPLGGSWLIESLTDRIEKNAYKYFDEIKLLGGVVNCIEEGYFQTQISNSSSAYQKLIESKKRVIIGINDFIKENEEIDIPILEIDESVEKNQINKIKKIKQDRNEKNARKSLEELKVSAEKGFNLVKPIINASMAYCTLGEMVDILKSVYGTWEEKSII